ncbi:unnamed protein product [Prorocentrum cordatum]|uniref:HNH nuclease domain-containing protein n=1 Tax=Prorocentrum cordatum TaxID=2364126 RepID=A0ABN9XW39_9DINO|nr:unnamed protein product [Polarella glacialis]
MITPTPSRMLIYSRRVILGLIELSIPSIPLSKPVLVSRQSSTKSKYVPLVSSYGRIRAANGIISMGSCAVSRPCTTNIGGRSCLVHRLVARAFLGPPPAGKTDVRHKDGVRWNNHVGNLEYVSKSQNLVISHRNRNNIIVASPGNCRPVVGRKNGTASWQVFPSILEASRSLGLSRDCIRRCCQHRQDQTGGYEFRYENACVVDLRCEMWMRALDPNSDGELSTWSISSRGRLRNTRGHVSWGSPNRSGYRTVTISSDGVKKQFKVHRLVARRFLGRGPIPWNMEVNHKDGDKANNCVENLEYVTRSQNMTHAYSMNPKPRNSMSLSKPVWARPKVDGTWSWYPSAREAARLLNVPQASISKCCHHKLSSTSGFEFIFGEPACAELLDGEEWREVVFDP